MKIKLENYCNELKKQIFEINKNINQMNYQYNYQINKINHPYNYQQNQMNYSYNSQTNQMSTYMNMMETNANTMNLNNNNIIISKEKNIDLIHNIKFIDINGKFIIIQSFDKNKTINELINSYLIKIGRNVHVNNYDNYYNFIFNVTLLNAIKSKKIKESGITLDNSIINVQNKTSFYF